MRDYKCGKCGREYRLDQYHRLPTVQRRPTGFYRDSRGIHWRDQRRNETYYRCHCGYIFGRNPLKIENSAKLPEYKLRIMATTTFTEINVGTDEVPKWYETKLSPAPYYDPLNEGKPVLIAFRSSFKWTYETLDDAERGHIRVIQLLRDRYFKLIVEEGGQLLIVDENPAFDKGRALLREMET